MLANKTKECSYDKTLKQFSSLPLWVWQPSITGVLRLQQNRKQSFQIIRTVVLKYPKCGKTKRKQFYFRKLCSKGINGMEHNILVCNVNYCQNQTCTECKLQWDISQQHFISNIYLSSSNSSNIEYPLYDNFNELNWTNFMKFTRTLHKFYAEIKVWIRAN